MTPIQSFIADLAKKSEERYNSFKIIDIDGIQEISEEAFLEKPTWLGGDKKFVCLFIDLDKSSKISFKKHPKTMAMLYDYFTQNIVDVMNHPDFGADYIDIKGDGAFGIFEGEKASYKALYCAMTFKTLFENIIRGKFSTAEEELSCKFGIHKDKILVRKIGKRGERNYNEVWAGRLVNNAAKLAAEAKNIPVQPIQPGALPILVSNEVYLDFERKKEFGFYQCCDGAGNISAINLSIFQEFNHFSDEVLGDKFHYTRVNWCPSHSDNYLNLI